MARSSLYVVIAVVCAAVVGCAASRDFADERGKLGQPVRGDEPVPKYRYNIQFNYTSEREYSDVDAACGARVITGPDYATDNLVSGDSWSFELGLFIKLECALNRFDGDQRWEIRTVFWEFSEEEPFPSDDKSYLIDDVGVYNLVQGEKKTLIAEWKEILDVLASAVQSA